MNNTWVFDSIKITRYSITVTHRNKEDDNYTRDYVEHFKDMTEQKLEERLEDLNKAIRLFWKKAKP